MYSTLIAAPVFAALALTAAQAEPAAAPAAGRCITGGYQHVAAMWPAECCKSRLQCSHYLSTTMVVKPAHDRRT